ncbi:HAMP domain-containing histidine kinase [Ensifer adhaerens]|uniref:sensor histidine kinase n=1 Tax=Ensifer adhaerens TaxID=106592 RepID=UPI001CBAA7E0|nr:HAMP domain-containing sensor histidine kinase [Ensifer adhaerens]MBZ7925480.1 HAMP domain-containing histidine kinase [Ensifer adhaerens]UAX95361.1 HAMP domain-containing histidine kinase [Ensifer adhaerens]UAY02747.1 HAMP domain-containing histidine kinase [Ensifer adhaerens]UAY10731.1 HAMP domain-containing histidine kinase [Ensifer adhaerens]
MKPRNPSLIGIVARRIIAFSLVAMAIQIGVVLADYWFDDDKLSVLMLQQETENLAAYVQVRNGVVTYEPNHEMRERYQDRHDDDGSIFLRIRTAAGVIVYSNCTSECAQHFLPVGVDAPQFWKRLIAPGKPFSVAGGQTFERGGTTVLIELAILNDPNGFVYGALLHEMFDSMIVPMTLMFCLVIGATIWSIRSALKPVAMAAQAADALDPRDGNARLPVTRMPQEIARLVTAVNRMLTRVADLVQSQKLFSSSIAHEIRTPVAIAKMELSRINDPRARNAERDLDALTHILEQLTSLARADAVDPAAYQRTSLSQIGASVAEAIAPFVFDHDKSLEFLDDGTPPVTAIPALVENMLRNLIENAVKHNPPGTRIILACGPGPVVSVEDNGKGLIDLPEHHEDLGYVKSSGQLGLGLKIVRRISELHQATIAIDTAPEHGTKISIDFSAAV